MMVSDANPRLWSIVKTILYGKITSMCGFIEQERMKQQG